MALRWPETTSPLSLSSHGPAAALPPLWPLAALACPHHAVKPQPAQMQTWGHKGSQTSRALSPSWGLLSLKWSPRAPGGLSCQGSHCPSRCSSVLPSISPPSGTREMQKKMELHWPSNVTAATQTVPARPPSPSQLRQHPVVGGAAWGPRPPRSLPVTQLPHILTAGMDY